MKCPYCGSESVSELSNSLLICLICGKRIPLDAKPDPLRRKKTSKKKERSVAKRLGGRRIPGSGALGEPGDIDLDSFLIEHKFTNSKSFRVTADILDKITVEALKQAKIPALVVEVEEQEFVVLRFKDFKMVLEAINENNQRPER